MVNSQQRLTLLDESSLDSMSNYTHRKSGMHPAVMPETPCHGDVFHIQQQFEQVANGLARRARGATTRRIEVEQKIAKARLTNSMTQKLTIEQVKAERREAPAGCPCPRCQNPIAVVFPRCDGPGWSRPSGTPRTL